MPDRTKWMRQLQKCRSASVDIPHPPRDLSRRVCDLLAEVVTEGTVKVEKEWQQAGLGFG